jgi:D-xylose transport system substrate-binding protein
MKVVRLTAAVVFALSLAACGTSPTSVVVPGKKIAFLMPDSKTPRYDSQDRPLFQAKVQSVCQDCQVLYSNARGDAALQQQQAESALSAGATVLVVDPVSRFSGAGIVDSAAKRRVPVIAYDSLILNTAGISYYVGIDNAAVGALQASTLLTAMKAPAKPTIVMLHGDPADPLASELKKAAHTALDGKVTIAREYDIPLSGSDDAQVEMAQALAALNDKVDGVYAANDEVASGAVVAMKQAHLKTLPPITGGNAELSAVQRILAGEQYMTVYRPVRQEAEAAAQLAYDLAYGVSVSGALTGGKTVNNNAGNLPAVLVQPLAVTRRTLISTVIADGVWTRADICTNEYATACRSAGLS